MLDRNRGRHAKGGPPSLQILDMPGNRKVSLDTLVEFIRQLNLVYLNLSGFEFSRISASAREAFCFAVADMQSLKELHLRASGELDR